MTSTIILYNDRNIHFPTPVNHMSTTGKIFYHAGRFFSRIKKTFEKTEVKISAILSYWALETVVTAMAIVALNSFIASAILAFIYAYGTYALFSAISALVEK